VCGIPYRYLAHTWDKKLLPKELLLHCYVFSPKLKPQFETLTLSEAQIFHYAKVILPHLNIEITIKRPSRNKKEAEGNAALLAYHHIHCNLTLVDPDVVVTEKK